MILLICIFRPFTGMGNKELGLWYGRRKGGFYRDELREGSGKRGAGTFWETADVCSSDLKQKCIRCYQCLSVCAFKVDQAKKGYPVE